MRVLVDHIVFQQQKIGGVTKALTEMLSHLPSDVVPIFAMKESDNLYIRESFSDIIDKPKLTFDNFLGGKPFRGRKRLYETLSGGGLIPSMESVNKKYCRRLMSKGDYDVFQPTHYNSHFLRYNRKPFVFIVHDLVPEMFPEYFPADFSDIIQREILVTKADRIVAISENTKKDILARWRVPEDRVEVIYWGAPDVSGIEFKKVVPYEYILYVGGRTRYKGFDFFVRQAAGFLRSRKDLRVVCTGSDFTPTELSVLEELGIRNQFVAMTVSTEILFSLYHFALCFVFPSEYEGFGLPTLEAMACGCPVILSDASCFPEIGGDAALYMKRYASGGSNLGELLDYVAGLDVDHRERLISACTARAAEFSWDECGRKYAEVYKSLI